MSCSDYAEGNWCTLNGQYGTHWNEKWKSIEENSMNEYGIYHITAWNWGSYKVATQKTKKNFNRF